MNRLSERVRCLNATTRRPHTRWRRPADYVRREVVAGSNAVAFNLHASLLADSLVCSADPRTPTRASEQTLPPTFILEQNFQRYLPPSGLSRCFCGCDFGAVFIGRGAGRGA